METKEYIVALNKGVDYNQFWEEMENFTSGLPHIPDRVVSISNNLDSLERMCHYALTDDEANNVRNDPRVSGVDIPIEFRDDIKIGFSSIQTGDFTKTTSSSGSYINWGLIRHNNNNLIDTYGSGTTTTKNYNYVADGTGVDIVIIDSGIQANHPEFQFIGNTTSRANTSWNWGGMVSNTSTFYTDYHGHGTHCTGIAAGKTFGWAKNSNIYSIKLDGLQGAGDPDSGLTLANMASSLLSWHQNKANTRPTVASFSVGYYYTTANANPSYYTVANVRYRGTTYNSPGWNNATYGIVNFSQNYMIPINGLGSPYDDYFTHLTDAGVIFCKAAGNDGLKVDLPSASSAADYNNYMWVTRNSTGVSTQCYYMRGSIGTLANTITVGNMDKTPLNENTDKKANDSNAGPAVDIFAAGTNIMSCTSNTNILSGVVNSTGFKQTNISGTSMACPQVAGIAALYLQANPTASPSQVKTWLLNNTTSNIYANTANVGANDYGNTSSQWGGTAGVAYQAVQGITQIKDTTGTWKYVANVRVKTDDTTWANVQAIWTKVDSTTWRQSV
jgi:subtilisin family serine protease